jgi:hypothetical protein
MNQSIGTEQCAVYYEWVLVVVACHAFQTTGQQVESVGATARHRGQLHRFGFNLSEYVTMIT